MRFKWRFVFSLRVLIAVVSAFAVATAWVSERARKSRQIIQAIHRAGGTADYDVKWEYEDSKRIMLGLPAREPASGYRRLQLRHPEYFFEIKVVWLNNRELTTEVRDCLYRLPRLGWLELDHTDFSDEDLARLSSALNLGLLRCQATNLTDRGAAELRRFRNLSSLDIRDTKITDEGLGYLAGLQSLTLLRLDEYRNGQKRPTGHRFSDEAVAKLQRSLPYCSINGAQTPASLAELRHQSLEDYFASVRN